jgi:hypothetical protein
MGHCNKALKYVGFQVLTAASMKSIAFREVALCSLVEVDRRFRGAYCLHHQGGETVMMEAVRTSETSVFLNEITQRYVSQGCHLQVLTQIS